MNKSHRRIAIWIALVVAARTGYAAGLPLDANGDPLPPGVVLRLGETRFRPGVRVTHLAFSADGKKLASWGNWLYVEDRFSIWDAATGKELVVQPTAEDLIHCVRWASNGQAYAVLFREMPGLDGIRIVRLTDPKSVLPKPKVGNDGTFRILPAIRPNTDNYSRLDLSPDGKLLAAFRSGKSGPGIDLFEAKPCNSGNELTKIRSFETKEESCNGLRFVNGSDSLLFLSGGNDNAVATATATLYATANGKVERSCEIPVPTSQGVRRVYDLSADGKTIVTGSEDGKVTLVDLATRKKVWTITLPLSPYGKGWDAVSAVKFVPGKRILAAGRNNRQFVLDAATGKTVRELHGHFSWVEAVAVSPDGTRVATAGQDSLIRVWDAKTWESIAPPKGHIDRIWKMDVSRDGRHVVTVGGDKLACVWDLKTGAEVRAIPAIPDQNARFTPDGKAVVRTDKLGDIESFPLPGGAPVKLTPTGQVLGFSPNGKTLATAAGTTVFLWDWPTHSGAVVRLTIRLNDKATTAAFSPDGRTVLLGTDRAKLTVVDVATGRVEGTFPGPAYSDMAVVAPDNRTVVMDSRDRIITWNLSTRVMIKAFDRPGPTRTSNLYAIGFALSPNGRVAATAMSSGDVMLYETLSGQSRRILAGHRSSVFRVAFTPDGKRLISAGEDHQALVWDVTFAGLAGPVMPFAAQDVAAAWERLNAVKAADAVPLLARLAADPKPAVAALAKVLTPVPAIIDAKQLDRIVADLDDAVFAVREKASRELDSLGEAAVGGIRERLRTVASAEVRKRIEVFLKTYGSNTLSDERLWEARAFEWLGSIDSAESRTLLTALAAGADGAWRTEQAKAVLRTR